MSKVGSTSEHLVNVENLSASLQRFADDRDWRQFHSPKNLLLALTGEVGELCEIFQWMSEADSMDAAKRPETAQAVKDELADAGKATTPRSPPASRALNISALM